MYICGFHLKSAAWIQANVVDLVQVVRPEFFSHNLPAVVVW